MFKFSIVFIVYVKYYYRRFPKNTLFKRKLNKENGGHLVYGQTATLPTGLQIHLQSLSAVWLQRSQRVVVTNFIAAVNNTSKIKLTIVIIAK